MKFTEGTIDLGHFWCTNVWAPDPPPPNRNALEGGSPPPQGRPAYAQPLFPQRQVPASMAFVTDSNRPQPLWQPPPTACLTASGATSEAASF